MSTIDKILYAGLNKDIPDFLKRRVYPTNLICLLLLFGIALPFTIISIFYFSYLAMFPAVGMVVCVVAIILNVNGGIYYSRFIVSLLPILLGAIYNAYLSNDGEQPLPALYLIELSFTMIPFVIYDLRERAALVSLSLICALIIVTFPITNGWFVSDIDSTVLRTGWLSTLTIVLSIICALGCIWGLAMLNKKAENESEELIREMNRKNKILEESEAAMRENLKKIEAVQLLEKNRNWITEGIAMILGILRTSNSEQIYDKLIAGIVKYMKANQAGLYVIDIGENSNKIKLAACYAYERKKFLEQEFNPIEAGLLGQTYLERQHIYITDIPENYMRITSGLGGHTPKALMIMPLAVNDIIEGIIEIAFFHELEPHEIEFLSKAGEGIASFIHTNRINEKTAFLLQQTMHQAEDMRAQEEELRQNLEEMEAIHEENSRKEAEYLRQIQELKSNIELTAKAGI